MTKPLAVIFYEKLLPGSRLVTRLQDLGYRVELNSDPNQLLAQAIQSKPLVILASLYSQQRNICDIIRDLRQNPDTQHIPVLAYTDKDSLQHQEAAVEAGASLVSASEGILVQLPHLLEQVLEFH